MQMDRACVSRFFIPSLFAIESTLIATLFRVAITPSWFQMRRDCLFVAIDVARLNLWNHC